MNPEALELDFHLVGNGERSGDAISVQYTTQGLTYVHVVDGGTQESGEEMVNFINRHYCEPEWIDAVVCTHGDDDHSSGLRAVIQAFDVRAIYMNRPWLYASEILSQFEGNYTAEGLAKVIRDSFPILAEIEDIAESKGIEIREAFQGTDIGAFKVLSPSRERYLSLIPLFSRTPDAVNASAPATNIFRAFAQRALDLVPESWNTETLEDLVQDPTSASNESSVVQYANIDGRRILLTGDVGQDGLNEAIDYAGDIGIALPGLDFIQVPHHGSRRNVSKSVLNRLLGEPLLIEGDEHIFGVVSVSTGSETHPRKKVTNAFKRRGVAVVKTTADGLLYRGLTTTPRYGWNGVPERLPLYTEVEE